MQNQKQPTNDTFLYKSALAFIVAGLAGIMALTSWHNPPGFIIMLSWLAVFSGCIVALVMAVRYVTIHYEQFAKGLLLHQRANVVKANTKLLTKQLDLLEQEALTRVMDRGYNFESSDKGIKLYTPKESVHYSEGTRYNISEEGQKLLAGPPPQPFTLSGMLNTVDPTEIAVPLANSNTGIVTTQLGDAMCHVASSIGSGGGKTNLHRHMAAILLYLEQYVYICDLTWQDIRPLNDGRRMDYRPFLPKLAAPPFTKPGAIAELLKDQYQDLKRRVEAGQHKSMRYARKYIIVDELANSAKENPDIMTYFNFIARMGRNYGIFLIAASQDWQVVTLGAKEGAFRDNFATAFCGQPDASAYKLLGRNKSELDFQGVGRQGAFLLRQGSEINKVRVPFADNDGIYTLLGEPAIPLDDIPVEDYQEDAYTEMEPIFSKPDVSNFQRGIEAYRQGATSVNKLEQALSISHRQAYNLYQQIARNEPGNSPERE